MLEVTDLHAYYGKSHILHGVHLSVGKGEIVSLLGRNGVGRSTTIRSVMGMVECRGSVRFQGEELVGLKAYQIAHKGLGYVPENRDIFPTLTVRQNLLLGQKSKAESGRWKMDDMFELFPRLRERAENEAGVLSGGEQQMLAIGRGLASAPKLLMLDEPSMGLAPAIADFIFEKLIEIRAQTRLTIVLVEQRVAEALESADHGYVLEAGRVVLEGNKETLRADDRVRRAYLGM